MLALALIAVFAPLLTPYDPYEMTVAQRLRPPSTEHWMGTDEFGRDILTRLVHGARITFQIGLISVAVGFLVGAPLGLLAGYAGRKVDLVISALTDILLAFPNFLLALAIVSALGPSLENAMIAVGVRTVPLFTRLVRASTIATRDLEFVTAARTVGAGHLRVLARHITPNILAPVIILATLEFPAAVLVAAGLSFLGLGAQPPAPEWGAMVNDGRPFLLTAPQLMIYPGLAISVVVIAFNVLGDGLRDLLDPGIVGR